MLDANPKGGTVMKTASSLLALVNSLLAGLIVAFSLSPKEIQDSTIVWLLTRVLAALLAIGISLLTWRSNGHSISMPLILLANLFLVALGAATIVWTFHLALVTGDLESYMVLYGGSLMLQGALSQLNGIPKTKNTTAI